MEYVKLVAVSGLPGLFELVNSKSDGAIVRSLDDKSTRFISSRIHNFSHLESIEVYTTGENVNLVEIFNAMDAAGGQLPDEKDQEAVKKYFEKVYPDLDFERVYYSDLKKMIRWFEVLKQHKIEIKLSEPEEETGLTEEEETLQTMEELDSEEKTTPKKKTAKKAATKRTK
jgi:phosphoenolpyruvate carboxylase